MFFGDVATVLRFIDDQTLKPGRVTKNSKDNITAGSSLNIAE